MHYIPQLICAERYHTSPEVAKMEWHIDARKRNCGKAALESNVALRLLQLLSALVARVDDFTKHILDLTQGNRSQSTA
jgi:hypothetical protein